MALVNAAIIHPALPASSAVILLKYRKTLVQIRLVISIMASHLPNLILLSICMRPPVCAYSVLFAFPFAVFPFHAVLGLLPFLLWVKVIRPFFHLPFRCPENDVFVPAGCLRSER